MRLSAALFDVDLMRFAYGGARASVSPCRRRFQRDVLMLRALPLIAATPCLRDMLPPPVCLFTMLDAAMFISVAYYVLRRRATFRHCRSPPISPDTPLFRFARLLQLRY